MSKNNNHHDFNLLRSLEVFLAIAEHGQLTRAASALKISQSAVSQHLGNLENVYSTQLLDRSLRPMQLTLTGQALRQHASEILHKVDSVNHDLIQLEQPQIPMLRVGMLPSLATLLTPILIDQAKALYQVPRISLYADLSSTHQQLIKSRQVDLLITSQPFYDMDGLVRYPILEEFFVLILPPGFDGFDGDLENLSRQLPMMRFSATTPVGLLIDQHLRRCQVHIERYFDADRTTMIMAAVAAGHGFSILSPTLLLDGLIEGMLLQVIKLPVKPLARTIMLVNRESELDQLPLVLSHAIKSKLEQSISQFINAGEHMVHF